MNYRERPSGIVYDLFKKYNLECVAIRDYVDVNINSQEGRAMPIQWINPIGDFANRIETSLHFNNFYVIFHNMDELEKGIVFLLLMEVKL